MKGRKKVWNLRNQFYTNVSEILVKKKRCAREHSLRKKRILSYFCHSFDVKIETFQKMCLLQ